MAHFEIIRQRRETWRERLALSLRSIVLGPWNPRDREIAKYFGGAPVSAGVAINEYSAMTYSAVWAAVNLISSHIASVPLPLYRRTEQGRGKERMMGHPTYRLIHDRPNPQMGSMIFRRTLQAHTLVWGNGYAEIERDEIGRPVNLWPLLPYSVLPRLEGGILRYLVQNPSGSQVTIPASDMLHIRGLGDDGICGYSVIQKARESIGLGVAAERFGGTFFGNGSSFGGVITYPSSPSPQVRKENREALEKQHQGVDRAHRFLALYEGAKYERLGIPPNDAQFLETRQFQIEEVCRWFNLPPHKLKHLERSTNNNIEHQGIEYVTDTLDPWWVIWEEELTMKLIPVLERGQQLIEHVREGLLRGDQAARGEFQSKQFAVAAVTPNEIRSTENRNPIAGGDRAFVALNLIPLDLVDDWWKTEIEAKKAKADAAKNPPAPAPQPAPLFDEDDERVLLARHAAQAAEDARDLALQLRDDAQTQLAEAKGSLDAARADLETTRATLAAIEARVRECETARDEAQADVVTRQGALDAALAEVAGLTTERDAEKAARAQDATNHAATLAAVQDARTQAETDRDAALELAAKAEHDRDTVRAEAEALSASLRQANDTIASSLGDVQALAAKIQTVEGERSAFASEVETLKTDVARARADLATELEQRHAQRALLLAAMRSLFVDVTKRLIQRELDRARNNQATADKFRAWVDRFYPLHVEAVRDAFRPLVGPWTVVAGGSPQVLLDRLVRDHVAQSTDALRLILEGDDDERAASLERLCKRWDEERPEAMADALMREGMAGHG